MVQERILVCMAIIVKRLIELTLGGHNFFKNNILIKDIMLTFSWAMFIGNFKLCISTKYI